MKWFNSFPDFWVDALSVCRRAVEAFQAMHAGGSQAACIHGCCVCLHVGAIPIYLGGKHKEDRKREH